jgi:RNA polymerase sigma factor (sigma-70 family)
MNAAEFYRENLKLINEAIGIICRRHGMTRDEEKDFAQHVHLQLIENDYKKLRAYKGTGNLKFYLCTVSSRIFIDQVRSRWNPSTEAKRIGTTAVQLEKLVYRHQYAVHEACQILAANPATALDENNAHAILGRLHFKSPRPTLVDDPEEHLPKFPDPAPDPEEFLMQKQLRQQKQKVMTLIGEVLGSLSREDVLLIKLYFISGRKISEIARLLGKPDSMLYKRSRAILQILRDSMTAAGVGRVEIQELLREMSELDE